jgi:hypothetical protein
MDQMRAARNDVFAARSIYAALKYAALVLNEDPASANHAERLAFAKRVIRGEERPRLFAAFLIAAVPQLQTTIDNQPAQRGGNISDVNLDNAVAAIWTARSLAQS